MAATGKWRMAAILVLGLTLDARVEASQQVMSKMSATFFKALQECKKELSVSEETLRGLERFWREETAIADREIGCVIICIASKQDLITADDYKMHHDNAYNFAREHGADDETAKSIVKMIHDCEGKFDEDPDHCARVVQVSKCFRDEIHRLKWAPPFEVLIEEVIGA